MVEKLALSSRLNALAGYITELRDFTRYSREEFIGEPHIHHLAERFLHLASESVLDATQHVIAEMGFRQPNNYKDAIQVLHEEDVLESDLADRLKGWMGFRNVLVHLYLEIDHERSFQAIHDELGDLQAFAARMARFLGD